MSLPDEFINAQKRIWNYFVEGTLPRKHWPKHFMSGNEMKILFDEVSEYRNVCNSIYKIMPSEEYPQGVLWKDYAIELEKKQKL
jgi:hypothetical protein